MDTKTLRKFEKTKKRLDLPEINTGDTIKVTYKLKEKDKERLQSYEGIVISVSNPGLGKTITVRKISGGIGVEKIFPIHSPFIEAVEVIKKGKVRRAKLYYMRERVGKLATKVKSKKIDTEAETPPKK